MKKLIVFAVLVAFLSGGLILSVGVTESSAKSLFVPKANNAMCPVTGKAIPKSSKGDFMANQPKTIYEGQYYYFASVPAVQEFKKASASQQTKYINSVSKSRAAY